MSIPLDGLVSGLSTTDLIKQLIDLERIPQLRLARRRETASNTVKALQGINSKITATRSAGRQLADPAQWGATRATSSAEAVATASAGAGALTGTLAFTVTSLATAGSLASTGTVASTAVSVASGPVLVGVGGAALGIASTSDGGGLAMGAHTVKVVGASAGASKTGSAPLAASTTISAANDTLDVRINGMDTTITLAHGSNLTREQVAANITSSSGGLLSASIDGTGALVLTTAAEGSATTFRVNVSSAATAFNLPTGGPDATGTDGVVEIDGTTHTITNATAGATHSLASGSGGTMSLTLAGGLRTGSMTVTKVDTSDGTLATVVSAINQATTGVSAAAVQVAPGQYRLQLTSTKTGLAHDVTIDPAAFAGLGSLARTTNAADAVVTVGTGPGAYQVTSPSNSLRGLLTGVTIELKSLGSTTVRVDRDAEKLANLVQSMVDSANGAINEMRALTRYDASNNTAGLLMGNFAVRNVQTRLSTSMIDQVVTSTLQSATFAGVSTTKEGTLAFDRAKFLTAYQNDPNAVAALFQRGGIASDSRVSLFSATDRTRADTYDVEITAAAERAEAVGAVVGGGVITNAETIEIRVGTTVATYAASPGAALADIASGLNAALSSAGTAGDVVVAVQGGALVVRSVGYGTGASFAVRTSDVGAGQTGIATAAGSWETHTGVDVAGTIDGVAATGTGQLLAAPVGHESLAGLTLMITASPADVVGPTSLGTFQYVPGVAQRLASAANDAIDAVSGTLTAVIEGRTNEITRLTGDIERWEQRIQARELQLRRQFTAMERALSAARAQGDWLQSQLSGLQANSRRN